MDVAGMRFGSGGDVARLRQAAISSAPVFGARRSRFGVPHGTPRAVPFVGSNPDVPIRNKAPRNVGLVSYWSQL